MNVIFAVLLHVDEKQLPTILSTLAGSAKLVSVTPTTPADHAEPLKQRRFKYVGGKRNKGITGIDLIRKIITEPRIYHLDEIGKHFIENGFAESSCSPALAACVNGGVLKSLGNGKYCLPGTILKL